MADEETEPAEETVSPPPAPEKQPQVRTEGRRVVVEQEGGSLEMSDSVIAGIIRKELEGLEGVYGLEGGTWDQLRTVLSRSYVPRTIRIERDGDSLVINLRVCVRFGTGIPAKAREIRDHVKKAVESMVGCCVAEVNVAIDRVGAGPPQKEDSPRPGDESEPQGNDNANTEG